MKKLLFLLTEPRSANGVCAAAVMNDLALLGYEVHCVTCADAGEGVNGVRSAACDYERDGVFYHTVKQRFSIRAAERASTLNGARAKLLGRIAALVGRAKTLLSYPTWPLISTAFCRRIFLKARAVVKEYGIDTVVPINKQIDTLIAAQKIKRKKPEITYVPYLLDALAAGHGPRCFSREWTVERGLKWENKLFKSADRVIMMRSAEPFYLERRNNLHYSNKLAFIDLPLFDPRLSKSTSREDGVTDIVYVGTIPAHIRDPRRFIELFSGINDESLRLTIIGSSTCEEYLTAAAASDKRIKLLPTVAHDEAVRAMQSADFLLNLGNNIENMTPCKIFEYMSCAKPIISTAPIKNEPSIKYLREYPAALILDEKRDSDELRAELCDFLKRERGREIDPVSLCEVFYLNTTDAFIKELSGI